MAPTSVLEFVQKFQMLESIIYHRHVTKELPNNATSMWACEHTLVVNRNGAKALELGKTVRGADRNKEGALTKQDSKV